MKTPNANSQKTRSITQALRPVGATNRCKATKMTRMVFEANRIEYGARTNSFDVVLKLKRPRSYRRPIATIPELEAAV